MRSVGHARGVGAQADKTQATLLLAAKAVADVSPTAGTVLDVLADHAFGHYAEGLRQYLTIRCGSPEEGMEAFAKLRDEVTTEGTESLMAPPGIRAHLYRRAREISTAQPTPNATLAWFRPRSPKEAYRTGVARIRQDTGGEDRELLELRYARELGIDELAFVLEESEDTIVSRLADATERARKHFGGGADDLPRALLEAFALERLGDAAGVRDEEQEARVPTGVILGERYELEKHIGTGGFADVYRARDVEVPGHVVAVKVLRSPSSSKRARDAALKELRIIASVYHPSIVQFKDHGWHDDRLWFVMPWYEGDVLESRLDDGPLTRTEAHRIFPQLARALATLHASGIRHQDIKPDNIFLAKLKSFGLEHDVLPVLLDLGVAAKDAELVVAGTPTYFAPEVAAQFAYREGDPFPSMPIGPAADVFALALSLRNSLEPDTQPILVGGAVDTFIRTRAEVPVELPLNEDLAYLRPHFRRWLAMDPAERPTAEALAEELDTILVLPEVRRARRLGLLRLFGPLALAVLTIFSVVVWQLARTAQERGEKAAIAQEEAAAALADLEDANTQQQLLQSEIGAAQARIEASQLSRTELESQLANAEGRLGVTQRRLSRSERTALEKEKAAEAAQAALEENRARVTTLTRSVAALESAGREHDAQIGLVRRQLGEAQSSLATSEQAVLTARREAAQAATTRDQAQQELAAAERARAASDSALALARRELANSEARVAQLERELAAARDTTTPTLPNQIPPNQIPMVEIPSPDPIPPNQMGSTRMAPRQVPL